MFSAQVCGHLCVDLFPALTANPDLTPGALNDVGPLAVQVGGCVANTGGALAALGAPVQLVGRVGDDGLGQLLQSMLPELAGSATTRVDVRPGESTSYSLVLQPPGQDRVFFHSVGANNSFDGTDVDVSAADFLHIGYPPLLPALAADGGGPLAALLARARAAGVTTSVDMAYVDPAGPVGQLDWDAILRATLRLTDVFTPSTDDLTSALHHRIDPTPTGLRAEAARLVALGAGVVMVTAGPAGLAVRAGSAQRLRESRVLAPLAELWADADVWVPALPCAELAMTTGAGDTATAGLIYGLLSGLPPAAAAGLAVAAAAQRIVGRTRLLPYGDGSDYGTPHATPRRQPPAAAAAAEGAPCRRID